jgi:hypothetical protein
MGLISRVDVVQQRLRGEFRDHFIIVVTEKDYFDGGKFRNTITNIPDALVPHLSECGTKRLCGWRWQCSAEVWMVKPCDTVIMFSVMADDWRRDIDSIIHYIMRHYPDAKEI